MPTIIVTLTVLPANKVREHDRFIEVHCGLRTVRLMAAIAVLEAVCRDWWDMPPAREELLNAIIGRLSPVLHVPNGDISVDRVLEFTEKKLSNLSNVEVVVVRKDVCNEMPK